MTTPHIHAQVGDFAETVLLPGDPLRAAFIAENFLTDVRQVNTVRNMLGFTGYYQGQKVSVMGSGMGIPSFCIYAQELYQKFAVEKIIRIGSCGALQPQVKLRDVVIAMGASTDSNVVKQQHPGYQFAPIADYQLLEKAVNKARELELDWHVGNIFSADLFYNPDAEVNHKLQQSGLLAIEMEAAGLYSLAAKLGKKALAVCTVSDHLLTGEELDSEQRQTSFAQMMQLALSLL